MLYVEEDNIYAGVAKPGRPVTPEEELAEEEE